MQVYNDKLTLSSTFINPQVHLDAAHNSLKELPYGSANYWMHCLERLYLSHNELDEISRNITELAHLTTLDLSHNRICTLPPTSAWTNTKMNRISLAHNNLATLTHQSEEEQTYTRSGQLWHVHMQDTCQLIIILIGVTEQ